MWKEILKTKYIIIIAIIVTFFACQNGIINSDNYKVDLRELLTLSSKTWIKLEFNSTEIKSLILYKDEESIDVFKVSDLDTIIFVENLNENTEYTFKIEVFDSQGEIGTSKTIKVNTLGISSSNIVWNNHLFGVIGSVAQDIYVNQNNVGLAVGYFTQGEYADNGVALENSEWNLIQIPVKMFGSDSSFSNSKVTNILYYSESDIWVTTGAQFIHYNGLIWNKWQFAFDSLSGPFGRVRDMGVISEGNYMAVCDKGFLYQYKSENWRRISSPTTDDLITISSFNGSDADYTWIGGINALFLKISSADWISFVENNTIFSEDIVRINSITHLDRSNVFINVRKSGISYLYWINPADLSEVIEIFNTPYYCNKMSIIDKNSILFVNRSGEILYFNGSEIEKLPTNHVDDIYYSLHSAGNSIYIAGTRGESALILTGIKN